MERINFQQLTSGDWMQHLARWQKPMSVWVALICIAWSAWIVGQMVWMLPAEQTAVGGWVASTTTQTQTQSGMDISGLQQGDLFGQYNEQAPAVVKTVKVDAPKTRLNLELVGVVASSEPRLSLAVIANRGSQATYGLNEVIEGTRVKLKAVLPDRVIIDNSGRDETLMLEGIDYSKMSAQPAPAPSRAAQSASVDDKLDAIRAAVAKNPREIFQYVTLSQLKQDDKILGYRVSPGKDSALFESVGLQNGDIATQLNGLDLTDPDVMSKVFESISDLTEINLTVERDGQQHDIYIQF
ncbi:general secretion pathway protein C [Vibrio furnissii CIP 102972]|uniref:Type II secretion system protein GspC n=2 Tax=Vibrionaceae TaxID=641 RepID=A0A0Q2MFY9_VIBFU|nr:general secretion pathway protein C [Vibrio furnissii CIP 102972]KQH86626.1 type II secretion system protein GspC [Vibrio furnissii]QDC91576.1 type II secretion system protein GspC [Vibrio furnissii]SUP46945.1 type II secretory pathway, component EpsC [Vibrio furnissii]